MASCGLDRRWGTRGSGAPVVTTTSPPSAVALRSTPSRMRGGVAYPAAKVRAAAALSAVGGARGDDDVAALGGRLEVDAVEDARRGRVSGGEGEGGRGPVGGQGRAVVEGDAVANGEAPGGVVLPLPGDGQAFEGVAVGVEVDEGLGGGPARELEGVVGQGVQARAGRLEHGQADTAVGRGAAGTRAPRAGGDGAGRRSDPQQGQDVSSGDLRECGAGRARERGGRVCRVCHVKGPSVSGAGRHGGGR